MSHKRHLRTKTGKLPNGIKVEDQIFVQRDAPALEQACQRVVVGNFRAAHLQRRIKKEQCSSAFFNVFFYGIDGGLLVVPGRSGNHEDHAIVGNLRFLQEADRL